jgi:hypothetical protein
MRLVTRDDLALLDDLDDLDDDRDSDAAGGP